MRKVPATPIPSHTEGIGDGSANSVLIPEQFGPVAEWINKHIRSWHGGKGEGWPLYDYIVDDDWADTGLAEGTVINASTGTKIYSTPQGAWDDAKNTTKSVSIFVCPGTHAPLLIADDNKQPSYYIRFVGAGESSVIKGNVSQEEAVVVTSSDQDARPIHFENIRFTPYSVSYRCFDKATDYGPTLAFHGCRFDSYVRTDYVVIATDCLFDGDDLAASGLYCLDHASLGEANSWFWNCTFAGTVRPGGESYFIGCTHRSAGTANIAFDASAGTYDKILVVEGHTFRDSGANAYLNLFKIGQACNVRIKNCTDHSGLATNGAAVLITSAYNYNAGKIDIIGNTWLWAYNNTTAVGLDIQSASVESLLYVGNSHSSGYYVNTGQSNAVMVKCTGSGKSTRGIFGPNSPINGTYNVVGPDNVFVPPESWSGSGGTGTLSILYDNGSLSLGYNAFVCRFDNAIVTVAAGTTALTDNATNYIEVDAAGSVTDNTTGFTLGHIPLGTVVTLAGDITTITEQSATLDESVTNLYTANSILAANATHTPQATAVNQQEVVGRLTSGNIGGIALGILDDNILQVDHTTTAAANEYARFTANGLESRTEAEFKGDYNLEDADITALAHTEAHADFDDHSARHENGGADEISVAGLSGELADLQPVKAHNHTAAAADGGIATDDEHDGFSEYAEIAAPANPAANKGRLYVADDAGTTKLYFKDAAGTATDLLAAGAGDVATDAIWDAAGDLAVGTGANTAARLAKGNNDEVLTMVAGAVAWAAATGGGAMATDPLWDAAGDLAVGTGANTGAKLALTVPGAANLMNVLGVVNGETTPVWKVLFDATAPEPIGTAAAGTGVVAAHRNHVHAIAGANVHMITGSFYAVPESTTVPKLIIGPMPFAGTFVKLTIKSYAVAAESAIRVDLHKQTAANEDTASTSTTVFTTQTNRPTIAAAHYAGNTTTFEVSTFAKGDWLYFFLDVDDSGITVIQFGLEVTPT